MTIKPISCLVIKSLRQDSLHLGIWVMISDIKTWLSHIGPRKSAKFVRLSVRTEFCQRNMYPMWLPGCAKFSPLKICGGVGGWNWRWGMRTQCPTNNSQMHLMCIWLVIASLLFLIFLFFEEGLRLLHKVTTIDQEPHGMGMLTSCSPIRFAQGSHWFAQAFLLLSLEWPTYLAGI